MLSLLKDGWHCCPLEATTMANLLLNLGTPLKHSSRQGINPTGEEDHSAELTAEGVVGISDSQVAEET